MARRSRRRVSWVLLVILAIALIVLAAARVLPRGFWAPPASEQATATVQPPAAGTLTVSVLDVGQGDSILIRTPAGRNILVDGGPPGCGLVAKLQAAGVRVIDLLVVTHPHADHIGELPDTVKAFPVKEVWMSGKTSTSTIFEDLLDAITASGAKYREVHRGGRATLEDIQINVLNPGPKLAEDINETSIVLRLQYKDVSFLLTGDAGAMSEEQMLQSGETLRSTVLKVGHHGSTSSSTPAFLRAVRPEVAVWSAGRNNDYGHPHKETITNLQAVGAKVYGTANNGTVTMSTDGANLWVTTAADGRTVQVTGGRK